MVSTHTRTNVAFAAEREACMHCSRGIRRFREGEEERPVVIASLRTL